MFDAGGRRLGALAAGLLSLAAGAAEAQSLPAVYQYVRNAAASSDAQELHDVFHLDDGTTVVAGATDSLAWLEERCDAVLGNSTEELAAATSCTLAAGACAVAAGSGSCDYVAAVPSSQLTIDSGSIDNSGSTANRIGFVLALSGGSSMLPLHVSYFSAGEVDSVSRVRASSMPGQTTQFLYISGRLVTATGSGFFVGKLNRNFVRGSPSTLLWANTVATSAALSARQPWDVGVDGKVTLVATATDGSASWPELQRWNATGWPELVESWREHYTSAGVMVHESPASGSPTAVERSVVVLESGGSRCGLRSWTSATFNAWGTLRQPSGRGTWPHDLLMSRYCDTASPSLGRGSAAGNTGVVWDSSGSTEVSSVVVSRTDGSVYVALQGPSTAGAVPAVVAWSATGELLWWTRLMTETAEPTAPTLAAADLAIDYAGSQLTVLAYGQRAGETPRYFWADPNANGFQNSLGGTAPASSYSSWLAKVQLTDGVLTASTFVAELSIAAGAAGNAGFVDLGGDLEGFADMNQLPSDSELLGDTLCGDLQVDSAGMVYVSCTGGHTATTTDAYHAMPNVSGLGTPVGAASRNSFVRVYSADLSAVEFSTLVTGAFDAAGVGGDNVAIAAVSPIVGGLAVVANHDASKQANAIPTCQTCVTWGGAAPQAAGAAGIVGRFNSTGLAGWPVVQDDCAAGSESLMNETDPTVYSYSCVRTDTPPPQLDYQGRSLTGCLWLQSLCGAGRYAPTVNSPSCIACELGKYSDAAGATLASTCIQCPAGYAGAAEAATQISDCVECPAGSMSSATTGYACQDCVAGTYADAPRMTVCANCPRGKYSTTIASTAGSDCISCNAGTSGPSPGAATEAGGCL